MRRSVLLYNPRAGRWAAERRLGSLVAALARGGWAAEPEATGGPGDAARIARQAARGGAEVVFAFGGDGTLREAAAGLLGTAAALGPLPGGTVNVVPGWLGLPRSPLAAARALVGGRVRRIDVGLLGDEPFLMQASTGLDARVLERLRPRDKRRFGRLAVVLVALVEAVRYPYPEIRVDTGERELAGSFVAACNLPLYGGPFRLAPRATPDDGRLDLVVFRGGGPLATFALGVALALGRHTRRPDVEIERVRAVEIHPPPGLPVQLDGDALEAPRPAAIGLSPQRLKILGPPVGSATRSGG